MFVKLLSNLETKTLEPKLVNMNLIFSMGYLVLKKDLCSTLLCQTNKYRFHNIKPIQNIKFKPLSFEIKK